MDGASPPPSGLRFAGLINNLDCGTGLVTLKLGDIRQRILLTIETRGLPLGGCAGLPAGAWLEGRGTPAFDQPRLLIADEVRLRRPAANLAPGGS